MAVASGIDDALKEPQTTSSEEASLLEPQDSKLKKKHFQRTGSIWTAMAHIITGVIGAGVLSLAWSIAQLGWIGGPIALIAFAILTLISTFLLCDCYRSLPPVTKKLPSGECKDDGDDEESYYLPITSSDGLENQSTEKANSSCSSAAVHDSEGLEKCGGHEAADDDDDDERLRNVSYVQAVRRYLGEKQEIICSVIVQESLYGTGIAYTITAAVSIRAILQANCYHDEGHDATCSYDDTTYMVLFGAVQIVMSQIPNFHEMEWLSSVAAVMSFTYASIGCGLGIATVIANGTIQGGLGGIPATTTSSKLYLVFQAVGDIAFAFPFSIIVLDIQNTLRSPPSESQTMKKATTYSISITTLFYLLCGGFGYAAFGDSTPGNLLTGFGFYEPYWLLDFANACVVLHLIGGYQIYSQSVFAYVEDVIKKRFPGNGFVHDTHVIQPPVMGLPTVKVNLLRLCFRTVYVVSTTGIAIMFPYFNQVLGVLGALNFFPITIHFPVEMYIRKNCVENWSKRGVLLRLFSFAMFVVSVVAFVGSVQGVLTAKFSTSSS